MKSQFDEIIDFRQFFFKIIKNWYFFVISLAITFTIAFSLTDILTSSIIRKPHY